MNMKVVSLYDTGFKLNIRQAFGPTIIGRPPCLGSVA